MNTPFLKRFRKTAVRLGCLFALLFLFRLFYGYWSNGQETGYNGGMDYFGSLNNLRKNYASEKIGGTKVMPDAASFASSQKYEKTATVRSVSTHFEEDEAAIRKNVQAFGGLIQYEQSRGKKGSREIHLSIGVNPAAFDSFYVATRQIGQLRSTEVTKVDKTNEYRRLNAQKASLETNLASLNELKQKSGPISDFVGLHDKILEIETRLQELGVELGNYNTENEFCTVRWSLYEGATEREKIGLLQRIRVALEWTIKYYAVLIIAIAGVLAASFLLLLIIDKLKLFSAIVNKMRE